MDNARQVCRDAAMETPDAPAVFVLDNALDRAKAHPRTFALPRRCDLSALVAGDLVKLIFLAPAGGRPAAERMWVLITEGNFALGWKGTLANDPATLEGLHHGDPVRFFAHHVIAIERP